MSVLEEDTQRAGSREPTENKDPVDGIREKVMCNGGMKITTESSENGSGRGEEDSDPLDRSGTGSERCRHLDTRWTRDEEAVLNPQDISVNGHSSDSTSSGDETEEGDFAANWYVPLPQDPHQDDDDGAEEEEEEGEGWSKGTTGLSPPHREEQKEKEPFGGPDGVVGGASADKIKPLSTMEDSKFRLLC